MPIASSDVHPEIATRQEIQRRLDLYPLMLKALKRVEACAPTTTPQTCLYQPWFENVRAVITQAERQES